MEADKKMPTAEVNASDMGVGMTEDYPPPPQNIPFWKKVLYHLWDADQHLKTKEERMLVRKLDFGILICATLGWWCKYIDQTNLTNAYVSGMKEELNIQGNEYTYMQMMYTIAFAIVQIPANMVALKVKPRYCILACELGWTIFTFAQAGVRTSEQMYAFRFMIGFFESAFSPIIIFLLGCWYSKSELAKRVAIWHITGFFGQATAGFMQAGIHASLDGHLGLSGWRWMYVVCGCMSLVVSISVWFLLPDYPHNTTAWYLTEDDKALAMRRAAKQGKAGITGKLDWALCKRMFTNWRLYILVITYVFYGNSCQSVNYFSIYLKEAGYSVTQRNVIPALGNIVTMFLDFSYGFWSDYTGNRLWFMVLPILCCTTVGNAILTAWDVGNTARVVGFFFTAGAFCTSVVWTWANEVNSQNAEERALTISAMNGIFYATNSFLPILIFPQTMGPEFPRGFPSTMAFGLAGAVCFVGADFLHRRQSKKEAARVASEPTVELSVDEEGKSAGEKEMDAKLSGSVEPVRGSVTVM